MPEQSKDEIDEMIEAAKAFIEQKKKEGWTQSDFAKALKEFFDEK